MSMAAVLRKTNPIMRLLLRDANTSIYISIPIHLFPVDFSHQRQIKPRNIQGLLHPQISVNRRVRNESNVRISKEIAVSGDLFFI